MLWGYWVWVHKDGEGGVGLFRVGKLMEFERVGRYLNDKMCLLLQTPSNLENNFQ